MSPKTLLYILMLSVFTSCEKADKALTLPPPGDLTRVVADIGNDYSKQVYVSLSANTQVTRNLKDWDLAFEASAGGYHIYLNTGKYMFACHTATNDFSNADTTGKYWNTDNDHLDDDSTAIGQWWVNGSSTGEVIAIDRGRVFHTGSTASQRFKKIKLEEVNATSYRFSYCDYNSSVPVSFTILKNKSYSLMYFSFDNGGKTIDIAPPKNEWDIVYTHYIHTYYDQPVGSPYRYYLVSGGLTNRWNDIKGLCLIKDSMPGYIDYNMINGLQASGYQMKATADFVGYDWKVIDNSFNYIILTSRYYLLKNSSGYYFKMRFIDFYNSAGQKGYITFDYQRL